MSTTRKYNTPPLIEALCEFQFEKTNNDYSLIEPSISEQLAEEYPKKNRVENINLILTNKDQRLTSSMEQGNLVRFSNKEETSLIHLDKTLFAVNQLKPYQSWEVFKPLILEKFRMYNNIARPTNLTKISLRYINRINLTFVEDLTLTDYIKYSILIPSGVSSSLASLNIRTEHMYNNNNDILAISFGNIQNKSAKVVSFALDMTYVMLNDSGNIIENLEKWLEIAHKNMNDAFENIITDNCRKNFN